MGYNDLKTINTLIMKICRFLFLLFAILGQCLSALSNTVYYKDNNLHLLFTLNTETKEAMVGDGIDYEHNALAYPPIDDPYWKYYYDLGWSNIIIPSQITYGANTYRAFARTTGVIKVTLPETIRDIGNEAFYWCVNLEEINIPKLVKSIGSGTFTLCRKLKILNLPENIETIGTEAFSDCQSLEKINIPAKCGSIANEAFNSCNSLSTLIFEDGAENITCGYTYQQSLDYQGQNGPTYRGQFADCPIKKLYLGRNIIFPTIGNVICRPFARILDVEFGDCVEHISNGLFRNSYIESALVLPKSLKTIGDEAFYGSDVLHQYELTLPSSLESIGSNAFGNNTKLQFVNCERNTPPTIDYNTFPSNLMFKVPNGCGETYRKDENWKTRRIIDLDDEYISINVKTPGTLYDRLIAQDFQLKDAIKLKLKGTLNEDDWAILKNMPNLYDIDLSDINIESIPDYLFTNNTSLYNIKLPKALTNISYKAFQGCTHLSGVITIPSSCTTIKSSSFYGTHINGFTYSGALSIEAYAFGNCNNLSDVIIDGEGTIVKSKAFEGCSLKKLTIGNGASVENDAFSNCSNFEELVFEDGIDSIADYAFSRCPIKTLSFLGNINYLGKDIFLNCKNLKTVFVDNIALWLSFHFPTIESSPLYNGAQLFVDGEEVTNLVIPSGVTAISKGSFYGCKNITSARFPSSLKMIDDYAFYGCVNLMDFQLPNQLKNIGEGAFKSCSSLTKLDLPQSLLTIGEYAFSSCGNLSTIVAHWEEPITVNNTMFNGVSVNCYLYVPIGTATKYASAGWDIPNMKAAGILTITTNIGGVVSSFDSNITNGTEQIFFTPYRTFYIAFVPEDGFVINRVKLNGENVTTQLENGKLCIEEPEENLSISVTFADTSIAMGDVNGDGVINETDAICIVRSILNNNPEQVFEYAGDLNGDGEVNITDCVILVKTLLTNE